MYIVLLLIVALILVYFSRPKDKESYHKTILAIFGIAYFCIWRFLDFYIESFYPNESFKNIAFLSLMAIAFISGLLPWVIKITQTKAYAFVAIFAVSVLITFGFEKEIKNLIAEWGGYYDDAVPTLALPSKENKTTLYQYEAGGYSINVPGSWQKKTNESGLDYFIKQTKKNKSAELRPTCFHNTKITLPKIISNIIKSSRNQGLKTEKYCYKTNNALITCFVRISGMDELNKNERWRWIATDKNQKQNMQLDFVFNGGVLKDKEEANAIIKSFKHIPLSEPLPFCTSSAEWF